MVLQAHNSLYREYRNKKKWPIKDWFYRYKFIVYFAGGYRDQYLAFGDLYDDLNNCGAGSFVATQSIIDPIKAEVYLSDSNDALYLKLKYNVELIDNIWLRIIRLGRGV